MAPVDEFALRIRRFSYRDLIALWDRLEDRKPVDWPGGRAFEYAILRAFELEGADVRYPFTVSIQDQIVEQIDGVVYAHGLAALVESKERIEAVNVEPIARLRNQLMRRPGACLGMIFSRSGFTEPALTLAQFLSPQTILLWQGNEIGRAVRGRSLMAGMRLKYQKAIETGLPDYNLLGGSA